MRCKKASAKRKYSSAIKNGGVTARTFGLQKHRRPELTRGDMFGGVTARRMGMAFAAITCLVFIVGLPVAVNLGLAPDTMTALVVQAGPRDAVLVTSPVRLSSTPDIVLEAGLVYDAGNSTGQKPANSTITRMMVDGALITVAASPGMTSSADVAEETLPAVLAQLAALTFDKLVVRRGTLVIASSDGRRAIFSDVSAEIASNHKTAYSAKGSALYRGSKLSFDAAWSLPPDKKPPLRLPVKLAVTSAAIDASIDGRLAVADGLRLQGSADVSIRKIRQLARWFGIGPTTSVDLRDIRLKSVLDWGAGTLTFSRASVSVDGNEGTGALALSTSTPVPAVDATLAFQNLDLSRYSALAPSLASLWPLGFGVPEDDVGPPLLTSFDADLRMSAAKVTLPYVQTGRAAVTIALKNGRLLADVAELEVEGGSFGGQINADLSGSVPRYGVRGKFDNVDGGRSFSELLHRNPLQGRVNVVLDLNGAGGTAGDVLGSLSGKVSFGLNEGGRLGLDLRALRYAAQRSDVKGWGAAGKGQTALEQLDGRVLVHSGVAAVELLQAKGGGLMINGSGSVDLAGRQLDLSLLFSNNAAPDRPATGSDTIRLSGSWADPAISAERLPKRTAAP